MSRRLWWITVLAVLALILIVAKANANENRPCGLGGSNKENRQLARCLSHQPGIQVQTKRAVKIGNCESGFYRKAHSGIYFGIYQQEKREFDVFQHQGPKWADKEFREHHYGIYSARGNILAAFAHVHDHGWGFIGVCD